MDNADIIDRLIEYRNVGPIGDTNTLGTLMDFYVIVDAIDEISRLKAENVSLKRQVLDLAVEQETKIHGKNIGFGRYISLGSGHFVRELGNGKWVLLRSVSQEYVVVKENCSYDECIRLFKKYS